MENFNRTEHWNKIYSKKEINEVSWYQPVPQTSLDFIINTNLSKDASIIDIGGGDSYFVDNLLEMGFENISVLDISQVALDKAKKRLGKSAEKVNWINTDVANFSPNENYDFWHDRAAFHFLTNEDDISKYIKTAENHINQNGILVIGTFSDEGPEKCSGIQVERYSEEKLISLFAENFIKDKSFKINHKTPFETEQNFIFCSFRRK